MNDRPLDWFKTARKESPVRRGRRRSSPGDCSRGDASSLFGYSCRRRFGSDRRCPIPRQQLGEARARPALGHFVDDASQIGVWVEAIQLGRFNDRIDMRGAPSAFVAPQEEIIFSCNCNLGVILPISGRLSLSTIAGIRCMGEVRGVF